MITQETAGLIWNCYREIGAAVALLAELEEAEKEFRDDVRKGRLKDTFGNRRDYEFGVPMDSSSHRLFSVKPSLAKSVIAAHIANKKAELAEANEKARIELDSVEVDSV
jgi:hypothetical protein